MARSLADSPDDYTRTRNNKLRNQSQHLRVSTLNFYKARLPLSKGRRGTRSVHATPVILEDSKTHRMNKKHTIHSNIAADTHAL